MFFPPQQLSWSQYPWTSFFLNRLSAASRATYLPAAHHQPRGISATDRQEVQHGHTHFMLCTQSTQRGTIPPYGLSCRFKCFAVTPGENSRCTMSPASAFAIATAAAGHSSAQGEHGKPGRSKDSQLRDRGCFVGNSAIVFCQRHGCA